MRWFTVFAPLLALFPGTWLGTRPAGWRPRGALIAVVLVTGLWSAGAAALGSVQPWMKFAYFWRHTPAAVLATPETPRPTWSAHLAAEWTRVRHWHQPFERDYFVRWYAKILNQHGLVRLKRWSAFTEAEQEAWVRQGLRDLHVVTDEMVKADDRTIACATAHFWLGKFHKRLGEKAQAIVEFNRAPGHLPAVHGGSAGEGNPRVTRSDPYGVICEKAPHGPVGANDLLGRPRQAPWDRARGVDSPYPKASVRSLLEASMCFGCARGSVRSSLPSDTRAQDDGTQAARPSRPASPRWSIVRARTP